MEGEVQLQVLSSPSRPPSEYQPPLALMKPSTDSTFNAVDYESNSNVNQDNQGDAQGNLNGNMSSQNDQMPEQLSGEGGEYLGQSNAEHYDASYDWSQFQPGQGMDPNNLNSQYVGDKQHMMDMNMNGVDDRWETASFQTMELPPVERELKLMRQKKLLIIAIIKALAKFGSTTHRIEYLTNKVRPKWNISLLIFITCIQVPKHNISLAYLLSLSPTNLSVFSVPL